MDPRQPDEEAPDGFHRPRQERSRRTLARIADATEELLARRGPGGVTVQEVIAAAGTSVGSFYARFDSKDAAVAYVRDRHWTEVRRMWADFLDPGRWEGLPAGCVTGEVVRRYARMVLADRRLARAFLLELLEDEDRARLEWIRTMDDEVADMVRTLVEEREGELSHPRPGDAAEVGFRIVLSAVRDYVLFADAEPDAARDRSLILGLTRMYGGLLGLPALPGSYRELLETCGAAAG